MAKKNTKKTQQLYQSERVPSTKTYTLARLCKSASGMYIVYYAASLVSGEKIRKRIYLNEGTQKEREKAAEKIIEQINKFLQEGYMLNEHNELVPPKKVEIEKEPTITTAIDLYDINPAKIKFLEAIHKAMQLKKNEVAEATYKNYITLQSKLIQWANDNAIHQLFLKDINEQHIFHFLDSQLAGNNISNKTYNNILTDISALFNVFCKRKIIKVNPCTNISKMIAETGKHLAYTNEQLAAIKSYMADNNERQLLNYVQFIYYTLARPKEVRFLKISDIDFKDRKIKIVASNAKNKKGQYVRIPDGLMSVIESMDLGKYPINHYVFSAKGTPDLEAVGRNYFYKRHRKMLDALSFSEGYTLYGYKHTAVTNLYYANVEMRYITEQCRHSSEYQTRIYLRALGLFRNEELEKKYPMF
jgi:integrase